MISQKNNSIKSVDKKNASIILWVAIKKGESKKMEELKNIKVAVRWAKNGRKYIWENPSQKKLAGLIKKYGVDQICDSCLWLEQ